MLNKRPRCCVYHHVFASIMAACMGRRVTYLSCYRRGKRAALLQNYLNLRKRVKGEPLGGQVSIVVTDIEGYSGDGCSMGRGRRCGSSHKPRQQELMLSVLYASLSLQACSFCSRHVALGGG